jgi:hypothetical protein
MEDSKNILQWLNDMLEKDNPDLELFETLLMTLKSEYNPKIKLIDFEYYNEERLMKAKEEKLICVRLQNFEKAASNRDLELDCQKHIGLKNQLDLIKSMFDLKDGYLLYYYFGTSLNDRKIREFYKRYI